MLNKNHLSRYTKLGQISSHIWFQNFNWDDLISMNMEPAFIPSIPEIKPPGKPIEYTEIAKGFRQWQPSKDQVNVPQENINTFKQWLEHF